MPLNPARRAGRPFKLPGPLQIIADPIRDALACGVVDDHSQFRSAVDREGGELQLEHAELGMAEPLQSLAGRRDVVVAPQGLELGASSGQLFDELRDFRVCPRAWRLPGTRRPRSAQRSANPPAWRECPHRQTSTEECCADHAEAWRSR